MKRSPSEHQVRESFPTFNQLRHHVVEWIPTNPNGTTVILCHGIFDIAWSWDRVAKELADRGYHTLAFDWRGHGQSERTPQATGYHFPDYVADLYALTTHYGLHKTSCYLVGHSLGGTVCSLFAGTFDHIANKLVLIEGLGPQDTKLKQAPQRLKNWIVESEQWQQKPSPAMGDTTIAKTRLLARHPYLDQEMATFLAEKSTTQIDPMGIRWSFDDRHRGISAQGFREDIFTEFLKKISTQTLVLFGEESGFSRLVQDRSQHIAKKTIRKVPRCGHMIHWQAPEACTRELLDFFEK